MELHICHLYPDALNLYGDRGNVICLQRRLQWRGIDVVTHTVKAGEPLRAGEYDIICLGDGQQFESQVLFTDLSGDKAEQLRSAARDGVAILAIGFGYQLLGQYLQTQDGARRDCVGVLDAYTVTGGTKLLGDMTFACPELGGETLAAFESHDGKTFLGDAARPLGTVLHGYGNNGKDGSEGARQENVFASYGHGCLLPKNPKLCDLILSTALERKYGAASLAPLDDGLEVLARDFIEGRLSHAASHH